MITLRSVAERALRVTGFLFVCAFFLLLAIVGCPADGLIWAEGFVVDEQRNPIAGATVTLKYPGDWLGSEITDRAETDDHGRFKTLIGYRPAPFTHASVWLYVHKDGFAYVERTIPPDGVKDILVTLKTSTRLDE